MSHKVTFFQYVIPSILSFALAGVYAIVDGFFVGNAIGDAGLSAINIAYPLVALLQAVGTGIGMGGAVKYAVNQAESKQQEAKHYIACSLWLMLISSVFLTVSIYTGSRAILSALGASGELLTLSDTYIQTMALGTVMQVFSTGLVPLMRNYGGSFCAMLAMIAGFIVNIFFDYAFIWKLDLGMYGAALATLIGQGVTMLFSLLYCIYKRKMFFILPRKSLLSTAFQIGKIGLAPFGLTLVPNISLVIINKFSTFYDGEQAIATYACISYIIWIVYLILQGVGDGSQPLMSMFFGMKNTKALQEIKRLAYSFAMLLAVCGAILLFILRGEIGILFGTSAVVNAGIIKIMPIFLISIPFVAVTRIATAAFYATEKSTLSYILTFLEPVAMLILMLVLPPLFGRQIMIWWSTVLARIIMAVLALVLTALSTAADAKSNFVALH